jgi:hypothetical protein
MDGKYLVFDFFVFKKYDLIATISGFVSIIISGSFIFCTEILTAENGRMAKVYSLDIGYFLWLFSMLFITISAGYLKITKKKDATAG